MCICINCLFLKTCKSYNFVEKMHNINSQTDRLYLDPKQTVLKNEILSISKGLKVNDWDIKECTNFMEKGGNWVFQR